MIKNNYNEQILIIALIIFLVLIPITTANNYNFNAKYKENLDRESLNSDKEIYTKITGSCYDFTFHGKKLLIRNVTIQASGSCLKISGWKHPFPTYFEKTASYFHADYFIGRFFEYPWGDEYDVRGIALGDIEWG